MKYSVKEIFTITKLIDKLTVMTNPLLIDLFFSLIRIFHCGSWVLSNFEEYRIIIQFIKSKLTWLIKFYSDYSNQNHAINIIGVLFIKILRMTSENLCSVALLDSNSNSTKNTLAKGKYSTILKDELFILNFLWENKKDEILLAGRDLFRIIISLSKSEIPELKKIIDDISLMFNSEKYLNLLYTKNSNNNTEGINFYSLVMIPPNFERKLKFVLFDVNKNNLNWYINYMIKDFLLNFVECNKTLYVDLIRYLITNFNSNLSFYSVPRYYLLGYFLMNIKNEVISGEAKQAIFIDWLFFNK